MDDGNIITEQKDIRKHSKAGITSFCLALASISFLVISVTIGALAVNQVENSTPNKILIIIPAIISFLSWFVGLSLSIYSVIQKKKKKLFGFIGLGINAFLSLFIIVLAILAMYGAA